MINFLAIMEKAVYTLGLITLQDQKIKSNNYHFWCVGRLINILVLFLLQHLSWIERYSTMKIGRFFSVWVYYHVSLNRQYALLNTLMDKIQLKTIDLGNIYLVIEHWVGAKSTHDPLYFCLLDLILYVQSTTFQIYRDMSSWVEPVLS